jgi:NADH-quinone oxidoreductase subunit E
VPLTESTRDELRALTQKFPVARAALLPMLHLVQSYEGYVSEDGIALCAEVLGLTKAEVGAVATFYTMYKREPVGDYLLSVCTNPTCKIAGGQEIYESYVEACGGAHVDPEGGVMVEHAECLGICDAAPVVQVNYEMFGPVTHDQAMDLLTKAKAGDPPASNRSGQVPPVFTAVERELSGIDDGVHEHLVEAARLQATSDVPPAYRSGETDIPVTHPGGDPAGHGGQAFAEAAGFATAAPPDPKAPDAAATDAAVSTDEQDVPGPEAEAAPADAAAAEDVEGEGPYREAEELGDQVTDPTAPPPHDASIGADETMDDHAGDGPPSARTGVPADAPEPGTVQRTPNDPHEAGAPPADDEEGGQ